MLEVLQQHLGTASENIPHHAFLFSGDMQDIQDTLKDFLHTTWNIPRSHPPVVFEYTYDSLGIDESRSLQALSLRKGFGEKQFFIIQARHLTHQAQNALLKLFEEPIESTIFFLIVPNHDTLLPTLRSRFQHVPVEKRQPEDDLADSFFKKNIAERLTHIAPILKEKDTDGAQKLIYSLLNYSTEKNIHTAREALLLCEYCLQSPSASLKQILEGLAHSLPQIQK